MTLEEFFFANMNEKTRSVGNTNGGLFLIYPYCVQYLVIYLVVRDAPLEILLSLVFYFKPEVL